MTVFSPSLPPAISITTNTVSSPGAAARAAVARKPGTTGPRAISADPFSVRSRKLRRFSMRLSLRPGGRLRELILRHEQSRVAHFQQTLGVVGRFGVPRGEA